MGILDGVSNAFSGAPKEPLMPPPSYPELGGMYAAWEQEDMTGTIGVALDNGSLILKIQSFLSGMEPVEITDPKTNIRRTDWKKVAEAKMNERGIRSVSMWVRGFLDKNAIMTFFPTYDDFKEFMMSFAEHLFMFLGQNMHDFELKANHASQVGWYVVEMVHITLQRGIGGNEKQGVYKQVKRIENIASNTNNPQAVPRGGIFRQ